jgi:membrane-associated phospholipid phosphatase
MVTSGYLAVQRTIIFPPWKVPLTWFDRAIPFEPRWVWAYLSLYLLNPLGPLFARSRKDLFGYARGILSFFAFGFMCFVIFPVAGPRPLFAGGYWLYDRLVLIDRAYNSFPSLHAACAVYAVLFASYASSDSCRYRLRKILLAFGWVWVGLILYSTIATRQHFFLDLPAGTLLGWLGYRFSVRRKFRTTDVSAVVDGEPA